MKSTTFSGVLFAKYFSSYDRDIAVVTVRSGKFTHKQQRLPIPTRAKKMFLIGPCWQVGQKGFEKREVDIDEHYAAILNGAAVGRSGTNSTRAQNCETSLPEPRRSCRSKQGFWQEQKKPCLWVRDISVQVRFHMIRPHSPCPQTM